MSFEDLLNEYRRRAGVPMKESLRDPESEGWMENERDKAAADPTRQYVDKISQMFRAIHDAAEQGYQETGHEGFAQILKAMGVMKESIIVEEDELSLYDITEFPSEDDEIAEIVSRAGVTEAEVADLGAFRQSKQRQQVSGEKDALRQELMQLLREKETLMAQVGDAIVKYIVRSAMLVIKEDPEIVQEMGARDEREALVKILQDEKFVDGQVEPAFTNLEEQVRFALKNWS